MKRLSIAEKNRLVDLGLPMMIKKIRRQQYLSYNVHQYGVVYKCDVLSESEIAEMQQQLIAEYGETDYKNACKMLKSFENKLTRLRNRMIYMFQKPCIFLTMTFNKFYITYPLDVLRNYICKYLKSLNCPYVANADWGKENNRLHFHAVVQTDYIDSKRYIYGNLDFQRIYISDDMKSLKKISSYVLKFSFHAMKISTKNMRVIYSRLPKSVEIPQLPDNVVIRSHVPIFRTSDKIFRFRKNPFVESKSKCPFCDHNLIYSKFLGFYKCPYCGTIFDDSSLLPSVD